MRDLIQGNNAVFNIFRTSLKIAFNNKLMIICFFIIGIIIGGCISITQLVYKTDLNYLSMISYFIINFAIGSVGSKIYFTLYTEYKKIEREISSVFKYSIIIIISGAATFVSYIATLPSVNSSLQTLLLLLLCVFNLIYGIMIIQIDIVGWDIFQLFSVGLKSFTKNFWKIIGIYIVSFVAIAIPCLAIIYPINSVFGTNFTVNKIIFGVFGGASIALNSFALSILLIHNNFIKDTVMPKLQLKL